jgi:hypothetical protein
MFTFLKWIWSTVKSIKDFFSPAIEKEPSHESGQLMRRVLAHKSWFDQISSLWVGQSFWMKLVCFLGLSLFAGLAGLVVGGLIVPIVLAVSVLLVSIVLHIALVFHEKKRHEGAKIFAEQAIALNQALEASGLFFKGAANELHLETNELKHQSEQLMGQVADIKHETQLIHQQNETLIPLVEEVSVGTELLVVKEKEVQDVFEVVITDLQSYDEVITKSTEKLVAAGVAATQFVGAVQDIQQSQRNYSQAVSSFCFFVDERVAAQKSQAKLDEDEFKEQLEYIAMLKRENDEDDILIQELKTLGYGALRAPEKYSFH